MYMPSDCIVHVRYLEGSMTQLGVWQTEKSLSMWLTAGTYWWQLLQLPAITLFLPSFWYRLLIICSAIYANTVGTVQIDNCHLSLCDLLMRIPYSPSPSDSTNFQYPMFISVVVVFYWLFISRRQYHHAALDLWRSDSGLTVVTSALISELKLALDRRLSSIVTQPSLLTTLMQDATRSSANAKRTVRPLQKY